MIVTDRFVCLHEPKTGGSFVAAALFRVHGVEWNLRFQLPIWLRGESTRHTRFGSFSFHAPKHGYASNVRPAHRDKPLVSSVRHPLDLYVSEYEFGWWKRRAFHDRYRALPDFHRRYPAFPELGFADFVRLANEAFGDQAPGAAAPGYLTTRFVRYYCRDAAAVIAHLREHPGDLAALRAALYPVHFLFTHRLNDDLHDYLLLQGYPEDAIAFIRGAAPRLPAGSRRTAAQRWPQYYTPALEAEVRAREALLLDLLPAFGTA